MFAEELNIQDLEQGSEKWLEYRKTRIGASDSACIMGVGFSTPFQLWKQKLGLETVTVNSAMRRGSEMEPIARQAFIDSIGIQVYPAVVESRVHPWMFASIDGLSLDGKTAVELKCPGEKDHALALKGLIPEKYFPQLQKTMLVLNLQMMYYFSFDGTQGVTVPVYADSEYQRLLVAKEHDFYKRLITFEQPELTERDYIPKTDPNFLYHVYEYSKLVNKRKEDDKLIEDHRNAIIHMADKQNVTGGGVRVQQVTRRGLVDYTKVPEIQGLDLEKYRKPSVSSVRITEVGE